LVCLERYGPEGVRRVAEERKNVPFELVSAIVTSNRPDFGWRDKDFV
jgi:hypothetical protein